MTSPGFVARAGCLAVGHAMHAGLLLWPTLVFAGLRGMGWSAGSFGLGIIGSAVLESLCAPGECDVREPGIRDRVALRVARWVGLGLLVLFWSAQIESLAGGSRSIGMQGTGGALLVAGTLLRIQAIRALGSQFVSDIRVGPQLVSDGIYAVLRHPSEIGLLLIAVGAPLLIGSPVTAAGAATLLLPISLWRMQRENRAWAAHPPDVGKLY